MPRSPATPLGAGRPGAADAALRRARRAARSRGSRSTARRRRPSPTARTEADGGRPRAGPGRRASACPVRRHASTRSASTRPIEPALAAWGRVAHRAVRAVGRRAAPARRDRARATAASPRCSAWPTTSCSPRTPPPTSTAPAAVEAVTGHATSTPDALGGAGSTPARPGWPSLVADDEDDAVAALADLLAHLPDNWLTSRRRGRCDRPRRPAVRRAPPTRCRPTARAVLRRARRARRRARRATACSRSTADHAPNVVTAYARLDGRAVADRRQPAAASGPGTLDIAAVAARPPATCRPPTPPACRSSPSSTRPGFEPGKDLEWRGMIRHGAELVHAYAAATVPRVCVILRKAYGGAYIVMDSRDDGQRPGAGLAHGRDRGDGRARRGRHPEPAGHRRGRRPRRRRGSRSSTTYQDRLHAPHRRRAGLRRRRSSTRPTPAPTSSPRFAPRSPPSAPTLPAPPPRQRPPADPAARPQEAPCCSTTRTVLVTGVLTPVVHRLHRAPASPRSRAPRWC